MSVRQPKLERGHRRSSALTNFGRGILVGIILAATAVYAFAMWMSQ